MTAKILCLTRGGEASYPNQDGAIAIAKDLDEELLFLYISSVQFLDHSAAPKVVDIESELDEMGEFLLVMAQERAQKAGVKADILVRRGNFQEKSSRMSSRSTPSRRLSSVHQPVIPGSSLKNI
jgi:nucleotide-binding universal stress UspA family protein